MKMCRWFAVLFLMLAVTGAPQSRAPRRKRLLAIGDVKGFQHDSVSHGLATIERIGYESGLWDTYIRTDSQLITKKKLGDNAKNLDDFDAIFLYTTGEIYLDGEQRNALLSFVKDDGKGLLGAHSATDTWYRWSQYGEMIGGYFDNHPWHKEVRVNIEDHTFPAMKHFADSITLNDEIYQFRDYSRDKVRVLMSLDVNSVDLHAKGVNRTDKDFAVTWVRDYGKGRVFYSSLGHENAVWDRKDIQQMWVEAVKWAMGMTQGVATPRPKAGE